MQAERAKLWLYITGWVAWLGGMTFSVISYMGVCSEACGEAHNWRCFGCHFEMIGLLFFPLLAIFYAASRSSRLAALFASWMVAGAFGSEIWLIFVQKYKIGHWCPVCLSIATCIGIIALTMSISYLLDLITVLKQGNKGSVMKSIWKGLSSLAVVGVGFFLAFIGVAKFNPLQAQEASIANAVIFGNLQSKIEVYVITDELCPACRAIEPALEKMSPNIMKLAKLVFVDYPLHDESVNLIPYNLSFMIHNKDKYFALRNALGELALKTSEPTEEQVRKAIASIGIRYKPLNYADVSIGIKYFKHLATEFDVHSTPTIVIINTANKKGKKLTGGKEITEANVLKAIAELKG